MSTLTIHTVETAPEGSKSQLENSQKANGFLPNLHGVLAGSPGLFEAYQTLHKLFSNSSFNADELTVVWQTINVEHECHYCVPAHTGIAKMMKVDDAISDALRNKTALPTEKLQALHNMTLAVVQKRGNVSEEDLSEFYAAGYTERNYLDIILGTAQKVISNYTNHAAQTPVDSAFESFAWKAEAKV